MLHFQLWISLIGAFLVWGVHFAGLYLAAEFAPQTIRVVAPILLVLGLATNGWIFKRANTANPFVATIGGGSAVISSIAILWQTLPVYV